jgi:hypothetical protein
MYGIHVFAHRTNIYNNRIVAYVEDHIITQQQLEIEMILFNGGRPLEEDLRERLRSKVLDTMVEKKIIAKEFERMKGQLPTSYVQKKYDEIQKTRFANSPRKFAEALRRYGKTKASYQDELKEDAIVEYMYGRNVLKPSVVSPLEIQNYYDCHRDELIRERQFDVDQVTLDSEDGEGITLVRECLEEILPYDALGQRLTQIPGVEIHSMEGLVEGDMQPLIGEKITTMEVGTFTQEPILLGNQAIFLGLRSVREEYPLSLDEARTFIEQTLLNEKYQLLRENWIQSLKQKSYYTIL